MERERRWWAALIWPGVLVVAFILGQGRQEVVVAGSHTRLILGIALQAVAVAVICGAVGLYCLLRYGHPVPGHGRRRHAVLQSDEELRVLLGGGGVREEAPGMWSGPAGEQRQ